MLLSLLEVEQTKIAAQIRGNFTAFTRGLTLGVSDYVHTITGNGQIMIHLGSATPETFVSKVLTKVAEGSYIIEHDRI